MTLTGTAPDSATVTVSDGGANPLGTTTASSTGGWSFTTADLSAGAYAFTATDTTSGGTSAVAPLMSALVVLLNQAKRKNVGFLNPFLYANVALGIVQDVTVGTNAITDTLKGYNAGPGWDACTGLGSPDGVALVKALLGTIASKAST